MSHRKSSTHGFTNEGYNDRGRSSTSYMSSPTRGGFLSSHSQVEPVSMQGSTMWGQARKRDVSPYNASQEKDGEEGEYEGFSNARWMYHRKRIGLSQVVSASEQTRDVEKKRHAVKEFVLNNFKRKKCIRFIPQKDGVHCGCGEVVENHISGSKGVPEFYEHGASYNKNDFDNEKPSVEWDKKKYIKSFPTNAYGRINFTNEGSGAFKPSKYVRLADDTDAGLILEFMLDHWKLRRNMPNLVITVIGGAKNFRLDGKKKEVFNRGLVEAAQTTHAWVITGGSNMGIMKAVGEAIRQGQSYLMDHHGMSHTLRCIGIAQWGYVENRKALTSKTEDGCWDASYKVNNIIKHKQPVSLNGDHTHFILVDDGKRLCFSPNEVRANLEARITKELGVPVVLLVVEGGADAIDDVNKSLKKNIPVVLCEGTGRAADILAFAYNDYVYHKHVSLRRDKAVLEQRKRIVRNMLDKAYGETWRERDLKSADKKFKKYVDLVMECCEAEKLITVFDMNKNDDLDTFILSALLQSQGKDQMLLDQLNLALTWDRSDIAEEKIFSQDIGWTTTDLDTAMTNALLENKVNFVRLMLANGVVMQEFLTVKKLRSLYRAVPKQSLFYKQLKRYAEDRSYEDLHLRDVLRVIQKLKVNYSNPMYYADSFNDRKHRNENDHFDVPFRELFLWAVLMNRQELAKFLWERCDEAIPAALSASRVYGSLANMVQHYDHDMRESYMESKQVFENLAVQVLEECQYIDPDQACLLIERKYDTWGNTNCLEMAADANDQVFLSSVCCQNSLNTMWSRGISSRMFVVGLSLLFPPLILCLVKFQDLGSKGLNSGQKILTFFRAPCTKFMANLLMYLIFLCVYSFMLMFGLKRDMTWSEMLVLCWIFTLLAEEVREMFFLSTAGSVQQRLRDWWNFSYFNRVDLLILLCTLCSLILRFIDSTYEWGRTMYTVNGVCLFIRMLSFYSAHSYLGPKLNMITRMVQELMLYILILLVFLVAYGVTIQSLRYPNREPYWVVIRDVIYYPYWQIYGELFLEELEGRSDDCLGPDAANVTLSDGNPCPQYHWLVPILTALYLLIGNVLLLSLLIAIFTNVFEEIEKNSIKIWKYGLYYLIVEYDTKPGLAPPFVIFEHIYLCMKWVFRRTCCKKDVNDSLPLNIVEGLQLFEKECLKQISQKSKITDRDTMEKKLVFIESRVDSMARILEAQRRADHHEQLLSDDHHEDSPRKSVSPRVSRDSLNQYNFADTDHKVMKKFSNIQPIKESELESKPNNDTKPKNLDDTDTHIYDQPDLMKQRPYQDDPTYSKFADDKGDRERGDRSHRRSSSKRGKRKSHRKQKYSSEDDASDIDNEKFKEDVDSKLHSQQTKKQTIPTVRVDYPEPVDYNQFAPTPDMGATPKGYTPRTDPTVLAAGPGSSRINAMEERIAAMEDNTHKKLYNIEALLRNQIFYRGMQPPVRQQPPPKLPTMAFQPRD